MRIAVFLVVVVTGCSAGGAHATGSDATGIVADTTPRLATAGVGPQWVKDPDENCAPGQNFCYGNEEIHECTAQGTRGKLVYDCSKLSSGDAENPVVCSTNGGPGNVNFLQAEGDVGCERKFPYCQTQFEPPQFTANNYQDGQSFPNCQFYQTGTEYTAFDGNFQVPSSSNQEDNIHLLVQAPAGGFVVGQPVEIASDSENRAFGRVFGTDCKGPPPTYLSEQSFAGTFTLESLPPHFRVSVDLVCATDPTVTVKGKFEGR